MALDKKVLQQLMKDKKIKDSEDLNSFLKEVTKSVIEALYDGEMTDHFGHERNQKSENGNIRNGYSEKTVKSSSGEMGLQVPRDRNGSFEPQIVKKRQKDITGMEEKVISMYGLGLSTRDIQAHIEEIYGYSLSPESVRQSRMW